MAEKAAEIAGGHGADLVDINFGCPVSKIARRGAGSGMMREPDKMVEITRMVVDAVKLPVLLDTRFYAENLLLCNLSLESIFCLLIWFHLTALFLLLWCNILVFFFFFFQAI